MRRGSCVEITRARRCLCVAFVAVACGGGKKNATPLGSLGAAARGGGGAVISSAGAGGSSSTIASGGTPSASAGGRPSIVVEGSAGGDEAAGGSDVCATVTASAELEPVFLAFAFDVSGSMGKGDYPWHDATLKWDPVVAATRGFFEDAASAGLSASLTVFPIDAGEDERCDPNSYGEPDVSMRALPSSAFGAALDAIRAEDWRGGTPTLAVVEGVLASVAAYRSAHPGRYAFVLVTDGYPQGCDDDSIESVEDAVRKVAGDLPTYVIGVKNPPLMDDKGNLAPDTVSNLVGVAEAGGTQTAFIIDTGDASQTTESFLVAVEQIRSARIACNLAVPSPPDGRKFQKDRVVVSYASGSEETDLVYDADCSGKNGWHYDDLGAPTQVVLCPATCMTVQADAKAGLAVGFTCEPVIELPR